MAKKTAKTVKIEKKAVVASTTPVRSTPIPKVAAAAPVARREVTHDMIARRAYEIWASGQGGSEFENWVRAERELRGE